MDIGGLYGGLLGKSTCSRASRLTASPEEVLQKQKQKAKTVEALVERLWLFFFFFRLFFLCSFFAPTVRRRDRSIFQLLVLDGKHLPLFPRIFFFKFFLRVFASSFFASVFFLQFFSFGFFPSVFCFEVFVAFFSLQINKKTEKRSCLVPISYFFRRSRTDFLNYFDASSRFLDFEDRINVVKLFLILSILRR